MNQCNMPARETVHITNIVTGMEAEPYRHLYEKRKDRQPKKMADWVETSTLEVTTKIVELPADDATTVIFEELPSDGTDASGNLDLSYTEVELKERTNKELYKILEEEGNPQKPGINKSDLVKLILDKD